MALDVKDFTECWRTTHVVTNKHLLPSIDAVTIDETNL